MQNINDILAKIPLDDISRMQPKENPSTSLTKLKKTVDKLEMNQFYLLFNQSMTKSNLIKICSYLYENDIKTFNYIDMLITNLPKSTTKIFSQQFIQPQIDLSESAWNLVRIHPLFRAPNVLMPHNQFEPRLLPSAVSRFTCNFSHIDTDYYVVLSSPTISTFYMNLTIDSNIVVDVKHPVTSFPINITDSISEGYCHFRVSFHKLVGSVAFAIFPLERLTPPEVEACVMNRTPHLSGGEWGFCPISRGLTRFPVRGINCGHKDNFDLHAFVESAVKTGIWECPFCERKLAFEEICVDDDAYREMRNLSLENPEFAFQSFK